MHENTDNSQTPIHRNFNFEKTVHSISFKIWNPYYGTPELFVTEVKQSGYTTHADPEVFFFKLTGNQYQANKLSDYWRQAYQVPLRHPGSPFEIPTEHNQSGSPDLSNVSIADLAVIMRNRLFGPNGSIPLPHHRGTSSSSSTLPTDAVDPLDRSTSLSEQEQQSLDHLLTHLMTPILEDDAHEGDE